MSVLVTFEPSGISALVAEGTYLIDAARRMGVALGSGCTLGETPCPACLVSVASGADLLSHRSDLEERALEREEFDQSYRLACQVKIQSAGELVVRVSSKRIEAGSAQGGESDVRKKFGELPLTKKLATLLQLEAITMSEALDLAIQKPLSLGTRAIETVLRRASKLRAPVGPAENPVEKPSKNRS
jgi:uncharacterized 2Fe-2S/4Fe-4S cluster protein (DUF4445 family)